MKLIDKATVVAEIERLDNYWHLSKNASSQAFVENLFSFLDTLEVIDPYEQRVQYDSIKSGIQAQAETYSFNIESELYNQQTTKEGQKLWRKEIEEAFIIGGKVGVELAKDPRYKENIKVKEVDLHKELDDYIERQKAWVKDDWVVEYNNGDSFNHIYDLEKIAKHFFTLGIKAKDWEKERMEECPYRQVGCTMYEGKILECKGTCSWVVDYPKLKELKAQKGE